MKKKISIPFLAAVVVVLIAVIGVVHFKSSRKFPKNLLN
jgi:hypothetical protein